MGKKHGGDGLSSVARPRNQAMSLSEESSGKTQVDAASALRVQHLQRLAAWASREVGVGPIGALLGRRLAANAEAAGIPLGASSFLCQRCEAVLQPGFNCTIRIKNNKKKRKRCKKSSSCQNSISFACHFCGDQNLIRGRSKGVVKGLLSSRKPVNMESTSMISKRDSMNARKVTIKEGIEHSRAAVSHVELSSGIKPSTTEKDEKWERLKHNISEDSKVEELVKSPTVVRGQLAAGTVEEDITQNVIAESLNEKCVHETEPVSTEKIDKCQSDDTLQAEFPIGSKFFTQKNKLTGKIDPKDSSAASSMKNMWNKKREGYGLVTDKTPRSSSKSAQIASGKDTKSAPSGTALVTGNSRKRSRKGWSTLKQIAEKDEHERKEKMGNFVIPFFMQ